MGTKEYSQPASKSSWDSQDFGDVNMVVKMAHFHKSSRPQWVKIGWLFSRMLSSRKNGKHSLNICLKPNVHPKHCDSINRLTSNISCTLISNKFGDHSDEVGASHIGAAPIPSSLST